VGPEIVGEIRTLGLEIFLDLKLHDIPNTVAGAAAAAARLGVECFTVHALGGARMIARGVQAAAEAAACADAKPPTVLAVTILTSHDDDQLRSLGIAGPGREAVVRLAGIARDAGAGGIVCSPLEIGDVRDTFPAAVVVVPGIRPASLGVNASVRLDDQARTSTPGQAVRAGADRIVVGRPITAASDPAEAAEAVARDIESAGR
jgi:orotidine-5'-phosphate decarboxylase